MNRRAFFSAVAAIGAARVLPPSPAPSVLVVNVAPSDDIHAVIEQLRFVLPQMLDGNTGLRRFIQHAVQR
jgi:hypothetical protein